MTQISTKELLYLEDTSKLFDSIEKTCQHASSEVTDPQIRSLLTSMNSTHKQWIRSSAGFVTNRMQ
ncbi:MAG: hypothetical protein GXY50_08080 [Syntrophomonadaceae bacterium]|nr:hypothetical protein [Syntrophomonadaceae bacterium]